MFSCQLLRPSMIHRLLSGQPANYTRSTFTGTLNIETGMSQKNPLAHRKTHMQWIEQVDSRSVFTLSSRNWWRPPSKNVPESSLYCLITEYCLIKDLSDWVKWVEKLPKQKLFSVIMYVKSQNADLILFSTESTETVRLNVPLLSHNILNTNKGDAPLSLSPKYTNTIQFYRVIIGDNAY